MAADLIISGGRIVTMDVSRPAATAIAVKDGRILALGREEDVMHLRRPKTRLVAGGNKLILPGFTDCHVHLTATGLEMMRLDMSACACLADLCKMIADKAGAVKTGQWVLGAGYNEFNLAEKRLFTLKELDALAPENPVWLSRSDGHSSIVNSLAIDKLRIPAATAGLDADENGRPTGVLKAEANSLARQMINGALDPQTRKEALKLACAKMLSVGITAVHALEGGSLFCDEDVDVLTGEMENLPLHIRLYHQTTDVGKVLARGFRQIGGCLLIDGSLGSRTAALLEPYADAAGERGTLYFGDKELQEFVWEAHSHGMQITVHAIGDAAIEQILTAYEKALARRERPDHRHRIEHCSLPTPGQIVRCVKAGIVFSIQPAWGGPGQLTQSMGPARLGQERLRRLYPVASLLKAGGRVCAGSDSPISMAGPLLGIAGAGRHFIGEERISRLEAVALYTRDAAWAAFEERERGALAPGYVADMVILDEDLLTVAEDRVADIRVGMTIADGKIVYCGDSMANGL